MNINIVCLLVIGSMLISSMISWIVIVLHEDLRIPTLYESVIIYLFNFILVAMLAFAIYYKGFCCA
jgi:apolipoprotein N-acyltransferase